MASPLTSVSASTTPALECRHCGLPLTRGQRDRQEAFCCHGCERVYSLIHETGLDRYYDLRRGPGIPPLPRRADDFPWLDDALSGDGSVSLALDIQGIHCAACVWILENLFRRHDAGVSIRINPALGKVHLVWDTGREDLRTYLREAEDFGYRFAPERKGAAAGNSRNLLVRLGISAAAAVNVMIFTICYYAGLAPGDGLLYPVFGWLNLALATVSLVAGGWVFIRAALQGLRRRMVHLDLPIATGILLAYGGSLLEQLRHGPEAAYFDTVSAFIVLMLLGRWLQERVLERNRNAILADPGIDALYVRRFHDGNLESIPAASVRARDEIWVVPGDVIPVNGILIEDPAWIRLDWITGESGIQGVEPGEGLPAGAINAGSSPIRFTAGESFADSNLSRLLSAPATEPETDPRGWWGRVSVIYVAIVFVLAALGFLLWVGHGLDRGIQVAVAVLVITCPCALGLAVPLAHELTHLSLRRRGIFLRGRSFLERALSVRKILFDKTGTLTLGGLTLDPRSREQLALLAPEEQIALATLAGQSNHPVSRALAGVLREGEAHPAPSVVRETRVRETPGDGLEAVLSGRTYRLGRREFSLAGNRGPDVWTGDSGNATVFSADSREIAAFRFVEELKDDVPGELAELEQAGYDIYLASGDTASRVRRMADTLHIPRGRARGEMTPEAKAGWIGSLDARDTLMVGDGINDGPGFDAAYCTATPAVDHPSLPGRSDFYFLGTGIGAVREALVAARRLRRVTRDNLLVAVAYNLIALTLCFAGVVTPLAAAVLMPLSSIAIVTLTATRLADGRNRWTS